MLRFILSVYCLLGFGKFANLQVPPDIVYVPIQKNTFKIATASNVDAEWQVGIAGAVEEWNQLNTRIKFEYSDTTDYDIWLLQSELEDSILAQTITIVGDNDSTSYIQLNSIRYSEIEYKIPIIMHEFAHAVGIPHITNRLSLMNPVQNMDITTFTKEDKTFIKELLK